MCFRKSRIKKMIVSCSTSWKNDHICYRSCTGTSWQDTWNLLHVWNLPTFEHPSLLVCAWFGSNFIKGGLWFLCLLEYLLWLFDLDLWECCFHLALFGGRSVLWCLIRLTCSTWGSLATALMCLVVDFEDSIFLASCLTLLDGNLSKSMLESLMVLQTNSSSFKKN